MRHLLTFAVLFALCLAGVYAAEDSKDTPKAASTRKKLKAKVDADFKDTPLSEALDDLKSQAKVNFLIDTKGGVSRNQPITYKADQKPLDEVLDGMLKKGDLGYYIISERGEAYDGLIRIIKGKARGYPPKKE